MDMLAARSFRFLLAVTMAANCCLPCYTLAYADDLREVEDVSQEEQEEIVGDSGGLELSTGSGESVPDGSDGGAAAEGHVSYDGTAERAIEDTTSDFEGVADGFSFLVSDDLEPCFDDSNTVRIEEYSGYSEGDTSSIDGSLDSISQVDFATASPRAASKGFQVFLNSVISSLGANFGDTVYSDLTGWSGDGLIRVLIITIADIRQHLFKYLPQIDSNMRNARVDLDSMGTFWQTPVNGYYVTTLIYYIFDRLGVQNTRTSNIYDLMAKQWGSGYGGTKVTYDGSPADNLEKIRALLLSKVDDGYFTTWIYYIYDNGLKLREQNDRLYNFLSSQYDGRYFTTTVGYIYNALVANGKLTSKGFDDIYKFLSSKIGDGYFTTWIYYIYDNGLKIREQNDRLYSFLSSQYDGRYFTTTVGYIYNALVANGNLVSKGFSDMLDKLGSLSVSVDFDLSGVESRLDSVIRLLTAAGIVENSKDFFGAILGDLSLPSTASAIGSIKDVLSTAFPFCIPSVVNLVLFGSVVADPQAPCWEFDIAGSPLVVDFAPYEDFAEVCRWTVRLLFVAALLLNTRKFVYGMGGGQA